jgi:plastocyanin
MRIPVRIPVRLAALTGLVAAVALGAAATVSAQQPAAQPQPFQPRVTIIDNNGGFTPGEAGTGMWGFAPNHITVSKGQSIVFDNPAGNFRPHTVTSISVATVDGQRRLESGAKFDSSPTADTRITPGSSWTLETTDLDPGHYSYYCALHPWMVGSITVMPAQ